MMKTKPESATGDIQPYSRCSKCRQTGTVEAGPHGVVDPKLLKKEEGLLCQREVGCGGFANPEWFSSAWEPSLCAMAAGLMRQSLGLLIVLHTFGKQKAFSFAFTV